MGEERLGTMKENPENVKYVLVRRIPSVWKQGAKAAAVVAAIQAYFSMDGRDIGSFVFGIVIIFVAYWLFFTFLVWLWRVLTKRA
jgi:hypothetical protein